MPSHVALLRGINVGGHNRVAMSDLRAVLTALGHTEVATYIQSGNAVFSSAREDNAALAGELERALSHELGVSARVVVLGCAELRGAVAGNPYREPAEPKTLHAVFSAGELGPTTVEAVDAAVRAADESGSGESARIVGRTLYLHTPGGLGRSALAVRLARAGGPLAATAASTCRNWATVRRLLTMCEAGPGQPAESGRSADPSCAHRRTGDPTRVSAGGSRADRLGLPQ